MSIEAMRQALVALEHAVPKDMKQAKEQINAIQALRTAIQQPATGVPAGYLFDFKYEDETFRDWFTQNIDEIQFRPATCLNIRPLYAHPAPGVPDDVVRDAERYWWLRSLEHCNEAWCLIGSGNANSNLDAAIDAAMLAASPAQKGGE